MSPTKVIAPGKTPLERLTNFARSVIDVPKAEIEQAEKEWRRHQDKKKTASHSVRRKR